MSKGGKLSSEHSFIFLESDNSETPSKFLHNIGPGITPIITSHGDVNFFEKSFEQALSPLLEGSTSKLPPLKGVPALNSKLKLNSIQLISPPSDCGSSLSLPLSIAPEYIKGQQRVVNQPSEDYMLDRAPQSKLLNIPSTFFDGKYTSELHGPVAFVHRPLTSVHVQQSMNHDTGAPVWANSLQQAKSCSLEKQLKFQEKNRIAAMKSRQRKKKEWERLQSTERILLEENRMLKERIAILESEIRVFREATLTRNSK